MVTKGNLLWGSAAYRLWFVSDTSDVCAVSLRTLVVPLLALQLSGSQFVAGVIVAIESTIMMVLLPFGGTLADRWNRRHMMIALGVLGAGLSIAATVCLVAERLNTWSFALIIALFAVVNGLLGTSNDAILKSIVPMENFAKAQAIREGREACVELSGGAVAGFLYKLTQWCPFLVSAVLYLTSAVTALALPQSTGTRHRHADTATNEASFLKQFAEGWVWAMSQRVFLAAMVMGAAVNVACVGVVVGLQITLADQGVDPVLIGVVSTVSGVGALIGSALSGRLVDGVPTGKLIIGALSLFTISLVLLLVSTAYPVVLVSQGMAGLAFPALNAALLGFIYGKTPEDLQGRASAVFETTVGLLGALTPALAGYLLQTRGGFFSVAALALACAIVGLAIAVCSPIRGIPKPELWGNIML
ncbi:MFS transporter [Bifidobacterium eulemuris]|nr:MFS transporter [Bifidobacterium eulemuris]QOL33015.1 MFS transporter [Bifidobacterium eulemuris]